MQPPPATTPPPGRAPVQRGARIAVALLWGYALCLTLCAVMPGPLPAFVAGSVSWIAVPADLLAIATVMLAIRRSRGDARRCVGWSLLAAGVMVDLFFTVVWTRIAPDAMPFANAVANTLYTAYYVMASGACLAFYRSAGGSFRRLSTWLDILTILVSVMATMWAFLYQPAELPGHHGPGISAGVKLAYTFGIGMTMSAAALLITQIASWRGERPLVVVALASFVGLITDVAWLAWASGNPATLGPVEELGDFVFAFGDVHYATLVATAALFELGRRTATARERDGAIGSYSLVPALVMMLAIMLFVASEASRRGMTARALIATLVVGAILLLARQQHVRGEIRRLNRELARREAGARLTELVRCSTDVIAVVDASRALSFVSPAAADVLGANAAALQRGPAGALLGAAHEPALTHFLDRLVSQGAQPAVMELVQGAAGAEQRWLRITGRNQLDNPLIEGIVLTIADVTEQRTLEREVLTIASRERQRLSSDIHEGLGQELTGISMLLQSATARATHEPQSLAGFLDTITGHLARAIESARLLAKGLSPLMVVRGSLGSGLRHLALETGQRLPVRVACELDFREERIDDTTADYLYRTVQEAVSNALRHGNASLIEIRLREAAEHVELSVTDNGRGPSASRQRRGGLGLRMIEYRVRLLGGEIAFGPQPGGGSRLHVTVPVRDRAVVAAAG